MFYGDYYGIEHNNIQKVKGLETLIMLRKEKAYGRQNDYFDHPNYIGFTRQGDDEHIKSGLAVVISNTYDGEKNNVCWRKFCRK